MILQQLIEGLYDYPLEKVDKTDARDAIARLKAALNRGEVRAAERYGDTWRVNTWVKKGILLAFRVGALTKQSEGPFPYYDKDTMSLKSITPSDNIRVVPGGTAIRDGAYVGNGVILMPPAYLNIGAYVDDGTMIDSHALVGSCAQVGKRVHLSAGAQIGGVLEPVGAMPVIIEDDVMVGGNCGVYEGTIIREGAVLAAGVILTSSMPVYDLTNKQIIRKTGRSPLVIPRNAVVVPGARVVKGDWGESQGVSLYTPVIVKYRDARTDAATILEESLR
jgi:2,3,4,5-tetrahydropyridine-2-carboxylate N-succinyltransferase